MMEFGWRRIVRGPLTTGDINFQFSTELGWEIKGGKKVRMLKNPSYKRHHPRSFWNSCDSICGTEHWTLWGTPNCGKGQPMQDDGHWARRSTPRVFRNVRMGNRVLPGQ